MNLDRFTILQEPPPARAFIDLRAAQGWGRISRETATASLFAGLGNITAYDGETVAGFGRIVGDGAIYFYIQDLIVDERYQGQGLGARLLTDLIAQVKIMAAPQASIGLMSVAGKEKFYEKFGFVNRPEKALGSGMTLTLRDL